MSGTASTAPVALVTGASRGIGDHLVRALLDAGWRVVGLSRSGRVAEGAEGMPCDVTDAGAVERAVAEVVDRHGRIDLLVNNAGLIETEQPLWEADVDEWWQVMVTNVRGPFLLTRAVVPHMIAAGGGRIINLNSGSGTRESDVLTAYHASKSALARLTGGVALAGAEHGVLAFDMAPGVVESDMTRSMELHRGRTEWTDPEDVTALALAIADGELDGFNGRFVRAGTDDLDELRERSRSGLGEGVRMLRLRPWGDGDPVAG
ncbi:SDR family NAD(P)-dependent oxidoreductase [Ornithinimicrobium tianjinense]|uniref:2-deoxy-D-gluconate 3-dehydrogenase n=1 Tax=Ornithinimicrobium tianjinense TaxID=1195761 RepID=A0A917F512_9MICO|nr:SDR family oxidoreductase [Ornithinimicrobium tianjinense]GGF48777.1 2-deoxy-D-gluconate 3-dehydrogenase [Ornithinimicrobium tianjinense]